MKKAILIFITLIMLMLPLAGADQTSPVTISDINEDGWCNSLGGSRNNDTSTIHVDYHSAGGIREIGWIEWNVSVIPDSATIMNLYFSYMPQNTFTADIQVRNMTDNQPTTRTTAQLWTDIGASDVIAIITTGTADTVEQIELTPANLQNMLSSDWYAIGLLHTTGNEVDCNLSSSEGSYTPRIIVESDYGTYTITVHGLYYENGTNAGYVEVSYHDSDGDYEYNFTGTAYLGMNGTPTMINWPVSTDVRRIYLTTDEAQTYYLFTPEDTYATYSFSIIDYTGQTGEGDAYLEAYRPVSSTERLIERMKVQNTINVVPLNLVVDKTYRLQILFHDGVLYDWGYWVAGVDPTPTIVLSSLAFSQQAQMTYRYLSVEATRPNATRIRVNYEDTAPSTYGTDWCNITVYYRNETQVTTYNSTAETLTWNWYDADNETDYWVQVEIDHGFFTNTIEYWELLDYDRSYSSFPSLALTGWTFGGINTANLFSLILVLGVFGGFNRYSADLALIVAFSFAGFLRIVGANTWDYNVIVFGLALSVAFAVYRGRVRI